MAFVHGKGTFVSLDGDDLSAFSNQTEFVRTGDSHDVTTFGKNAHVKQGGLLDGTASISGVYDSTALTGPRAVIEPIIGTVVPLVHQPEGPGPANPRTPSTCSSSRTPRAPRWPTWSRGPSRWSCPTTS